MTYNRLYSYNSLIFLEETRIFLVRMGYSFGASKTNMQVINIDFFKDFFTKKEFCLLFKLDICQN